MSRKKKLALILLVALIILLLLLAMWWAWWRHPRISPQVPLETYTLTITHTTGGTTTPAPGNYTYLEGTVVTVNATAFTGYVFNHWELDGSKIASGPSIQVTMDANHTVHAVFKPLYTLTINSTTGGTTNPAPGNYQFAEGTIVNVTAIPNNGYIFDHWELDDVNQGAPNPINVTMNANHTLLAVFEKSPPQKYYLTVISPYGTPSGEGWYDEYTFAYAALDNNIVDHGNGTRRVFTHWSEDASGTNYSTSDPIYMDKNKTAVANWKTEYYLTVNSPYDSPTPTSGWFEAGTLITASVASPVSGPTGTRYVCTGWTGTGSVPASGTSTSVAFTISAPSSITWNWKTQYYLTVRTDPLGIVTIPGEGWYDASTSVSLTAPQVSDYTFQYWDVDGISQGDKFNPITVPMDGPHTTTAHYQKVTPPPAVGGYAAPISIAIEKEASPTSQIGLAFAFLVAMAVTILLIKRRSKKLKSES